jgi:hypothetical protein
MASPQMKTCSGALPCSPYQTATARLSSKSSCACSRQVPNTAWAGGAALVTAGAVQPAYGVYLVQSASEPGRSYAVVHVGGQWTCDCLDDVNRGGPCKHGWATTI